MHRADATCHWCGVLPTPSWQSPTVWRSAAAVLLSVTVAGAAWTFGSPLSVTARTPRTYASAAQATAAVPAGGVSSMPAPTMPDAAMPAAAGASAQPTVVPVAGVAADSGITWTPAVARTWVNVRDDASRGGQVVGVIKPDSRAMLGTDRAGWRQVRSPDITGWVDPRLFTADSLKIRGE